MKCIQFLGRWWFNMFNTMSIENIENLTQNTQIEVILKGGNTYISAKGDK